MTSTPTPVTPVTPVDDIDTLLARYLHLLDEYTTLRSTLTDLQTRIYQNIARANFSAERGVRYGQDLYDQRMQASRRLVVRGGDEEVGVRFEIKREEEELGKELGKETDEADEKEDDKKEKLTKRDPLRWFGILTPQALRQAQSQAIEAVEKMIPRLATVDAEMADVEIRVRRARKRRAKAEAAAGKDSTANLSVSRSNGIMA